MRLILLLAGRHLLFRPGKTLLSALGIAVGIATVVSVLVVDHNTLLSQASRRGAADPESDLLVQPLTRDPEAYPELARKLRTQPFLSGVTGFAADKWALSRDGRIAAGVELMALERGADSYHRAYAVAEGDNLDFDSPEPQLLVAAGLAEQAGVKVGDLVALTRPPARRGPVTRCVDGELVTVPARGGGRGAEAEPELHPFRVVGLLAPTNLGYARMRVLTTMDVGRPLLGPDFAPHFWADFDRAAIDFLGVEAALREHFVIKEPKRALAGEAPEEAAFRSGVRLCGFLALFLGLYIIFNTMSMSLVERVRQIGLLRALGLTRGRLLLIFLAEGLALALLGAGLAALLADWIIGAMQALGITTLGFGKPLEITEIPWGPVVAVAVAGVAFSLLGIIYPFLRASRLSVIDALRRGVIEMSRDPFTGTRRSLLLGLLALVPVAWFVGAPGEHVVATPLWEAFLQAVGIVGGALALLLTFQGLLPRAADALISVFRGPTIVLARSTVLSARHRVFATVTGLMLVFSAVFLVVSVLESLKSETRDFAEQALASRLYLKTNPEGAEQLARLRAEVPELATLLPLNVEVFSSFVVRAVDARMLTHGSLASEDALRVEYRTKPRVILSTRCADDFGYGVGDRLTLVTDAEGPVEFAVLAVTDEYGFAPDDRVFAGVSTEMMKRYWCKDAEGLGDDFVAWAPELPPGRMGPLRAEVEAIVGEGNLLRLLRGEDIAEQYLAQHDKDFGIFYAILLLTVLLAAVGVLNAMVIAVLERRREIGLLRAVGLTGGQVARMLLVESGAFGVLGGLLGLLLGLPLAVVCARALTALSHLDLSFELAPRALGAVLAGAVLVALLAVLYPALRANRLRLSQVMRYG